MRYLEIADALAEEIRSGAYEGSHFLPAERDLALRFQSSRTTIRAALRYLADHNIIRAEHGRGHRVLASGRPAAEPLLAVAVIMPFVTASTMNQIVRGCSAELEAHGYDLVRMDTTADTAATMRKRERAALESLIRKPMQGGIWWPSFPNDVAEIVELLRAHHVQMVTVDRTLPWLAFDHVGVDNVRAAYLAVEHLVTEGHTRIAHLTQEAPASTVTERRLGYEKALRDNGLEFCEDDILIWRDSAAERARLCHRLLTRSERPTAVFCVNDYIAVELLLLLQDFGARIPDDIAIVGFDNARESTLVRPALTTVAQPLAAIGATAARMLLERRSGAFNGPPRRVTLGTELIIRESSVRPAR